MTDQKTIRVGIVGAGDNTRTRHIPGLRAMPDVAIVGVINSSPESSQRVADEFDIPTTYTNWRELVTADNIDAVVIGTWPYMHHPVTLAALEAGKHVMVEARMAMNATQAREMHAASAARPDLVTQIVPSPMTLHLDNTIKRLLAEGYIGDIVAIEIRMNSGFADFESSLHWRHDMDLSGLNIMSMGIWYEALMRWVGTAKSVMAMGKTVVKTRIDSDNHLHTVQIPDHLTIVGEMGCGAQLQMTLSSVAGLAGTQGAWLYGTEGTLHIQDNELYRGQRGDSELSKIDIPEEESSGWRVEEEFVNAIRGLEPITHTAFTDGVKYMEFTEAVHRSMAQKRAVALPLTLD